MILRGRSRCCWEYNVEMDCAHEGSDRVECFNASQNKDMCHIVMNGLKESWAAESARKFLSHCRVIAF